MYGTHLNLNVLTHSVPTRVYSGHRVAIRCTGAVLLLATGGWALAALAREVPPPAYQLAAHRADVPAAVLYAVALRSEEHTSELQSLMRISYAVFCLKKTQKQKINHSNILSHVRISNST